VKIFGTTHGCFMAINMDGHKSHGAHLMLPSGTQIPSASLSDPILVTGVTAQQRERFSYVECFDNYNYTYAFGHDPKASSVQVDFMAMLVSGSVYTSGPGGGGGNLTNVVSQFSQQYKENRVSVNPKYAMVTLGGSSNVYKGFVIGMGTGTASPEYNLQMLSMLLAIPECQP